MANELKSAALTTAATLERWFTRKQPALPEFRNFLLPQYPKALGTALHATPIIDTLRAVLPDARLIAAASGAALQLLLDNPTLERVIATPSPTTDFRGSLQALRGAKPFGDEAFAVLQTQGNERSAITLTAMLSGGATRVGFTTLPQLSAVPLHFDPAQSQIANNLRIISALGHDAELRKQLAQNRELAEPRVFPTAAHLATAHALLAEKGIDESKPIGIFVTQTFIAQRKSWRPERFRAVAETLAREYDMQIVFAGTQAEASAIDELRGPLTIPNANIAGRTNLLELAALMQLADIALTLDTGPMHLARAVRLPMVIIAPAWSPPVEWLPLGNPRARILKNADLPAATPDYIIDEVSIAEVTQNLHELLRLYPPRMFNWR